MDKQVLMLYIMIFINQLVVYGTLICLLMRKDKALKGTLPIQNSKRKQNDKQSKAKDQKTEEKSDASSQYLDYINNFEVEV